jgi:hypothetical protein
MGIPYSREINAAFTQVTPLVAAGFSVLQTTKNISILLAVIQVLTVLFLAAILVVLVALCYCVNPDLEVCSKVLLFLLGGLYLRDGRDIGKMRTGSDYCFHVFIHDTRLLVYTVHTFRACIYKDMLSSTISFLLFFYSPVFFFTPLAFSPTSLPSPNALSPLFFQSIIRNQRTSSRA